MSWAGNWADSQGVGKLPGAALAELRAALAERAAAVQTPPALPAALASGSLPKAAWFSAFQAALSALIGQYVDHTQNGGAYDGLAAVPAWSEVNLLAALGDPARVAAPAAGKLLRPWAWQQHRLLNLLRWARHYDVDVTENPSTFLDASWPPSTPYSFSHSNALCKGFSSGDYDLKYVRVDYELAPVSGLTYDADLYSVSVGPTDPALDYFPVAPLDQEGVYNLVETATGLAGAQTVSHDFAGGDFGAAPDHGYTNGLGLSIAVLRYDGAGGFDYRDW